jgi:hypothetical protein
MNADLWFNPRITPRVRSWLVSVLVAGAGGVLVWVFR